MNASAVDTVLSIITEAMMEAPARWSCGSRSLNGVVLNRVTVEKLREALALVHDDDAPEPLVLDMSGLTADQIDKMREGLGRAWTKDDGTPTESIEDEAHGTMTLGSTEPPAGGDEGSAGAGL